MTTKNTPYLHGFSKKEQERLKTQAQFAEQKVYQDIDFSRTKKLLEVGCGVGAQSEILLRRFPKLNLTGIELNDAQLAVAKENLQNSPFTGDRYTLLKMDATKMDFQENTFDSAFLCWVLEHIPNPMKALNEVRRVLKPGSKVYITEVMNSSFFLEPYSPNLWKYWMAFNDFQYEQAGDPFVGAKLGNFLMALGFKDIETRVKTWHYDNRRPHARKEIIEYWRDLLMSAKQTLIDHKVIDPEIADKAQAELDEVTSDPNAVFFYSFIQASASV